MLNVNFVELITQCVKVSDTLARLYQRAPSLNNESCHLLRAPRGLLSAHLLQQFILQQFILQQSYNTCAVIPDIGQEMSLREFK